MALIRPILGLIMAGALSASAYANEWPTRQVRIVNTFSAGASSDAVARMAAEHLSTVLGQQFFVEAKPGGNGAVAIQTVTSADPNGYNFVLTSTGQITVAPTMNPKLSYDPMGDLVHVAFLAGSPTVISVSPRLGIKTIQELIDYAKKQPNPITYASSGVGSSGHLVGAAFVAEAGIKADHVPYRGATQSLMDVVAGHVTFSAQTISSSKGQIDSGALVPLAHSGEQRFAGYPNVPTFRELGFKQPIGLTWFALSAKQGTPADIITKMNREVNVAMHKPDIQSKLHGQGMVTYNWTPTELKKSIEEELIRWKPIIEGAGLIEK